MNEKKELGKWWIWITLLIMLSMALLGITKSLGIWGQTTAENIIFESSYQKQSADQDAINRYQAQLGEINYQLSTTTDKEIRNQLRSQAAMLRIQIQTKGN